MGHLSLSVFASLLVFLTYYILLTSVTAESAVPGDIRKSQSLQSKDSYKRFLRSSLADGSNVLGGQQRVLQLSRSKIPIELDLMLDEDEAFDKSKRYDDYGHMRFGKRAGGEDQFDDYGHMRFGKRGDIWDNGAAYIPDDDWYGIKELLNCEKYHIA